MFCNHDCTRLEANHISSAKRAFMMVLRHKNKSKLQSSSSTMTIFQEFVQQLFDICYTLVAICSIVSVSTIGLVLILFAWGAVQTSPAPAKTPGRAQVLGQVSSASMKNARLALLDKVIKKSAEKKQTTKGKKTQLPVSTNGKQCQPVRKTIVGTHSGPVTSPKLPLELQPCSLKHFFVNGATTFRAIPDLQHSNDAMAQLERIAREFMPIIQKRGYNIRSISEMCCCSNALEYELGGNRRCVAAGEKIAGNDPDQVAGYNGKIINRQGRAEHVIHVRLRSAHDHNSFMSFDEVVDTMAHELAHCVHEDHGPEFWAEMDAILKDRTKVIDELDKKGTTKASDPVASSKEQFGGFDIYRSFSAQLRKGDRQCACE